MTREEAIRRMECCRNFLANNYSDMGEPNFTAFNMAIKALEQEPILDKIRAEILEEKEYAYADFEQYKVDYLGQDEEDVLDSLPQDDFRYGMERTIEIIDKYRKEQE